MLRGEKIGLRARLEDDVPVLHRELHDDVLEYTRANDAPWQPKPPGRDWSPYALKEPDPANPSFAVVELATGELAGSACLWGLDTHQRAAHLGLGLRPGHRGRGLGVDTVRTLCVYGFRARGLHRLQLETLADNAAMIAAAERAGFCREGTRREAAWVFGSFVDEVVFGLLAADWTG